MGKHDRQRIPALCMINEVHTTTPRACTRTSSVLQYRFDYREKLFETTILIQYEALSTSLHGARHWSKHINMQTCCCQHSATQKTGGINIRQIDAVYLSQCKLWSPKHAPVGGANLNTQWNTISRLTPNKKQSERKGSPLNSAGTDPDELLSRKERN